MHDVKAGVGMAHEKLHELSEEQKGMFEATHRSLRGVENKVQILNSSTGAVIAANRAVLSGQQELQAAQSQLQSGLHKLSDETRQAMDSAVLKLDTLTAGAVRLAEQQRHFEQVQSALLESSQSVLMGQTGASVPWHATLPDPGWLFGERRIVHDGDAACKAIRWWCWCASTCVYLRQRAASYIVPHRVPHIVPTEERSFRFNLRRKVAKSS